MATTPERDIRPLDLDELKHSVLLKDVDLPSIQGILGEFSLMELERL
jgi:hypothetical protein